MAKHYAGARIQTLRRTHHLTQAAMAGRLDISVSYLNQLENDQRPLTVQVLLNFSRVFGVDTAYFVGTRDLVVINRLKESFPEADDAELSDFVDRYPSLADKLLNLQHTQELGSYELVRDFFYQQHAYVDVLDVAGEKLEHELGEAPMRTHRLAERLARETATTVNFRGDGDGPRRHFDPANRVLTLRSGLRDAQLTYELAMQYALNKHTEVLEELSAELPTPEARQVAMLGFAQYFAAAVIMPYQEFHRAAEACRYDIDRLAQQFGTSFEATCHRLSSLQRPGKNGVAFSFARIDRAGNVSKRQSATSYYLPRTSGTCPLWVAHRAFETPNRIVRQVGQMPDGRTYLWFARYVAESPSGFGADHKEFAVALGCEIDQAHRLIYSDGLDLSPSRPAQIGPGCTTCPREQCPQRAFPQAGRKVLVNLGESSEQRYLTA